MPAETMWLVDKRVLAQRFYGEVTVEEIHEANALAQTMIAEGVPLVHTIVDIRDVTRFPTNLSQLAKAVKFSNPELAGWNTIISTNVMTRFLGSAVTQLLGTRLRMFHDEDSVIDFLREQDESLPEIPVPVWVR